MLLRYQVRLAVVANILLPGLEEELTLDCYSALNGLDVLYYRACEHAPVVRCPAVGQHHKLKILLAVFVVSVKILCRIGQITF